MTEETVFAWLRRAAEQAAAINQQLWRAVKVTAVPRDELWRFIARQQATQAAVDGESTDVSADGRPWVRVSFAPECRVLRAA